MRELIDVKPGEVFLYRGKEYTLSSQSYSWNFFDHSEEDVYMHFISLDLHKEQFEKREEKWKKEKAAKIAGRIQRRNFNNWFLRIFSRGKTQQE